MHAIMNFQGRVLMSILSLAFLMHFILLPLPSTRIELRGRCGRDATGIELHVTIGTAREQMHMNVHFSIFKLYILAGIRGLIVGIRSNIFLPGCGPAYCIATICI